MSTATDLLETAEETATSKVHDYIEDGGVKPEASVWLQMLAETTGIVIRVSQYYLHYDGSEHVTVMSKDIIDQHSADGQYIESLLDYYEPEPLTLSNAPTWVET